MSRYSIIAILLLFAQGCSKGGPSGDIDSNILAIDVQIDRLGGRSVINQSTLPSGSTISVVIKNSNSSETSYGANGTKVDFTYNNSSWSTSTTLAPEQQGKVTAYYPSNLSSTLISADNSTLTPSIKSSETINIAGEATTKITLDGKLISLATSEVDYLVGAGTSVSASSVRTIIGLKHAMAMVAVRLIKGSTYSSTAQLTKIEIKNANAKTILANGSVNIETNDFAKGTTTVSYVRNITGYTGSVVNTEGMYVGLLAFPATLYEDGLAQIVLTVDAKAYTVNLPGGEDGLRYWLAGNCILYDVTISGTKVEISSVSIKPWESGSTSGDIGVK